MEPEGLMKTDGAGKRGEESDDGSERSGGERDGESFEEGETTGGVASETEEAAVTLEHLAFGRRKDEPSRPGPTSPEQPTIIPGHGRRASISFANPPSISSAFSSTTAAPFPISSFANDQPPLHTTHQHPASTSANRSSSSLLSQASSNFPTGGTIHPSSQPRRSSINSLTNNNHYPHRLLSPSTHIPDPSPPSPNHPSLPAGSTPFTLLNLQSKVAMGARGPTLSYGGPLGAKKMLPPLGTFGRVPGEVGRAKREEEIEGRRRMRERDLTDPKIVFDAFFQRSEIYMEAFLTCLPGERKERALIQHYFSRVEWFHHCLHVPTFLRECEEFWTIPFEQAVAECSASWVGVFLIIMCLSLHFLDDQEASRLGFSKEDQERLPAVWFAGTRGALWQSDFLTNHSLECLQIIILSGVYLANQDRADAHWGILGSGIKIAQMMGINRLGAEDPSRRWGGRWESLITREVGRRCWWNLVFLDWSLAPAYGYAATIHPEHMTTAFPGNIRDEDLIDGQPFRPLPLDVHTPMSYHLTRLRLIETAYQVIYIMNHSPHPPYEAILKVDQEFTDIEKTLPHYYQVNDEKPMGRPRSNRDEDLVLNWEKVVVNLSLQTQKLRLHRPYLSRGYKNAKYAYSTQQCIRAARAALSLIHEGVGFEGGVVFLEKWWITLFYSFVSTVVLLIDLLYTPRDQLWEEKLNEVKQALAYLKQIERTSSPARGTIKVIEALLIEVESRPVGAVPAPRKRGLSIDTASSTSEHEGNANGLQRAVRRLVHENEIVASSTSPNSSNDATDNTPSPAFLAAARPPNPLAPPETLAPGSLSMPANGNWLSAPTGFTPSVSPVMQYGYGGGPRPPNQFSTTVESGEEANLFGSPGGWNPTLGGSDSMLSSNLNSGNSE
ncbi:hypothetical protein BDY24DRAFT_397888 [Mrakia frigida]|uniref:fungal specific transcription factor domain-containing protein n=1 Tax=Mrakia frigida TaxID=29902 RepID=UPI003FCC1A56